MIPVSEGFKKAIKAPERKIKGYVEVLYDLPEMNITNFDSYAISPYTSINTLNDGSRVTNLYGSLDYLPLDGSMLTMSTTNPNSGIISTELYENISTPEIVVRFDEALVKGITLYFRTNIPTDLTIILSDESQYNVTNDKECIQVIFEEPKTISSLAIDINDVMYPDRKLYVNEIDLGVTQVYKDQDLIEFTVDEEVNKLVEEVPTNETNIILNNMSDLFNPLNPSGIVPYLSENTLIKPYIGVLTENNGVQYVKMGEFYFDSYTNNSDATTTLVGKNIIKRIENDELTDGLVGCNSAFMDMPSGESQNTTEGIISRLNYNLEFNPRDKTSYYFQFLDSIKLMDYLKDISIHDSSIVYANRDNKIVIRDAESTNVDSLTKQELIEDAKYKKIEKINTIIRNDTRVSSQGETQQGVNTTIFSSSNAQFVLTKSPQNFAIKNEAQRNVWNLSSNVVFTYTGASSASIVYGSNVYTIVQATGNVGDTVSFNCIYQNGTVKVETIGQTYEVTNKMPNEKKVALEINGAYNAFPATIRTNNELLNYASSYEMSFEYNGDPSLEAGDYINVETPYGYKPLFIQKNYFKFDGGLEGSIEGVE